MCSIKELIHYITDLTVTKSQTTFGAIPMRKNEQLYSCADITRMSELNWNIQYTLKEGLEEMFSELQGSYNADYR